MRRWRTAAAHRRRARRRTAPRLRARTTPARWRPGNRASTARGPDRPAAPDGTPARRPAVPAASAPRARHCVRAAPCAPAACARHAGPGRHRPRRRSGPARRARRPGVLQSPRCGQSPRPASHPNGRRRTWWRPAPTHRRPHRAAETGCPRPRCCRSPARSRAGAPRGRSPADRRPRRAASPAIPYRSAASAGGWPLQARRRPDRHTTARCPAAAAAPHPADARAHTRCPSPPRGRPATAAPGTSAQSPTGRTAPGTHAHRLPA